MARNPSQPGRRPSSCALAIDDDDDDDDDPAAAAAAAAAAAPDELTGIVSRGSEHNYQTLHTADTNQSRHSIYRRRPSRPQAPEEHQHQHQPKHQPQSQSQSQQADSDGGAQQPRSWLRKKLGALQSVELENTGSVARDHLALERTFLAWLRTSLAFASIGVAVTQLFRLNTTISGGDGYSGNATLRRLGKPLGSAFLAISILTLLLGARRYFHGQEWVIRGKFPASRGTIILIALVALAIMLASLVVVIVIHPPEDEL
ncbi:hypothetical protein UVI_02004380 [Ustilaginoidea virens]|nr:hypothetical protein UVI_02004380 [Ustilaginoidea virens]